MRQSPTQMALSELNELNELSAQGTWPPSPDGVLSAFAIQK